MRSSTCETSQCYDWPRSIQRSHIAPIPLCLGWIILAGPLSFFFLCALKHARVHVLQPRTRGPHGVLADHFVQPLNSFVLLVNRRHDVLEPLHSFTMRLACCGCVHRGNVSSLFFAFAVSCFSSSCDLLLSVRILIHTPEFLAQPRKLAQVLGTIECRESRQEREREREKFIDNQEVTEGR